MTKLTVQESILKTEDILRLTNIIQNSKYNDVRGQKLLNKIILLNCFVIELHNCLDTSNTTEGRMSDGTVIKTDYGYIVDFVSELESLTRERL